MAKSQFWRRLEESAETIQEFFERETLPDTLIVLGSGFKGFESQLTKAKSLDVADIEHFPVPGIAGHGASLVIGEAAGKEVAVLTGRVHLYEGHDANEVVYPIRVLSTLGVQKVLLTNAAGSVDPKIRPGEVVLASDQINLTGRNCLIGPDARELGPIFVDMGKCFDPPWRDKIRAFGQTVDGVYGGLLGPTYETPAETAMLRGMGLNVVGMSTVQEAIAAHQLRMRVVVLSFVTNMTGGLGDTLDHSDVIDLVAKHKAKLHELLIKAVGVAP